MPAKGRNVADVAEGHYVHAANGRNVAEGHYEAAQTMVAPAAFKCTCGRRKAIRRLADSSLPHPQRCTDVCSKNALRCQASSGNSTTPNATIMK